jgi:hypothetical protein
MINVAVITGAKSHDVIGFYHLFHHLAGINSYIQHLDDFASAPERVRDSYEAVLFFFMMLEGPTDEGLPGYCGKPKLALERLTQTGQGIVVLHHALLAYPKWSLWNHLVGITDRHLSSYKHDEQIPLKVVDKDHPITQGLSDWTIVDETYQMASATGNHHSLLTTTHPQSMGTLAWVHQYQNSKVFCFQLGHDRQAWEDKNYQTILKRGIEWSCGRIKGPQLRVIA